MNKIKQIFKEKFSRKEQDNREILNRAMKRFTASNMERIKTWMNDHGDTEKLPIFFNGKDMQWMSREQRRKQNR